MGNVLLAVQVAQVALNHRILCFRRMVLQLDVAG